MLLNALLGGSLLAQTFILGIFPEKYFTLASIGYGLTSNVVLLAYQLRQTYHRLGEGDLTIQPPNKYSWYAMAYQILCGAGLSFLGSAVYRGLSEGEGLWGYKYQEGWEVAISIGLGMFALFLMDPKTRQIFSDSVFGKLIKRIMAKDE